MVWKMVQDWYEAFVRKPALKAKRPDPGEWTLSCIRTHFYEHMVDLGMQQRQIIDTLRKIRRKLVREHLFEADEEGAVGVNAKNLDSLLKIDQTLLRVYTTGPQKGINHNPDLVMPAGGVITGKGTALDAPSAEGQRNTKRNAI